MIELQGLYNKFDVRMTDGRVDDDAQYFVINMATDIHTFPAIVAYALSIQDDNPALALELMGYITAQHGDNPDPPVANTWVMDALEGVPWRLRVDSDWRKTEPAAPAPAADAPPDDRVAEIAARYTEWIGSCQVWQDAHPDWFKPSDIRDLLTLVDQQQQRLAAVEAERDKGLDIANAYIDELLARIHEFNGDVPDLIGEFTPKYEALKAERDALAAQVAAARGALEHISRLDVHLAYGRIAREALAALDGEAGE